MSDVGMRVPVCPDCGGRVVPVTIEGYKMYYCDWCHENVDGGGDVYQPEWEETDEEATK